MKVRIAKDTQARIDRLIAEDKCLACECQFQPDERRTLGVHADTCYQSQAYAIRKGLTTVRELVKAGERLTAKKPGRKPATAYAARLLGRAGDEVAR